MDLANPDEVKFDVVISGWVWAYEDSILVFQFTLTESTHGTDQGTIEPDDFSHEGSRFDFGEGYMDYVEYAQAGESVVQVQGTYGRGTGQERGKSVYLAFEYFGDETLEYDPTLGIIPIVVAGFGIDYNQLLLVVGGVSIVSLVILSARIKR